MNDPTRYLPVIGRAVIGGIFLLRARRRITESSLRVRLSLPSCQRIPTSKTSLATRRQVVDAGMRRHDAVSANRALLEAVISPQALSGVGKIGAYAATTAAITAVGLPLAPLGWLIALIVEIGFGLMLLLGFRACPVAAVLAFWCVVTAVFFHSDLADQNIMIHFLKNLAIAGGLLQIVHFGAGALSVDARKVAPLAATNA
jgi:putative oxidoreductase